MAQERAEERVHFHLDGRHQPQTTETEDDKVESAEHIMPPLQTTSKASASQQEIATYIVIFFFAMILHELALEAASTEFIELDSLASAVTLFQFGFCVLLPLAFSRGKALQRFPTNVRGFVPYIKLSAVVFGATALATQSLQFVTYPTKVVFKSAKLIPTMIVATILQGKRFGTLDYVAALLLCGGAAGYSFGTGTKSSDVENNSWKGLVLLIISIICDALVPNLQEKLMKSRASISSTDSKGANSSGLPVVATVRPKVSTLTKDMTGNLTASELMVNTNSVGFMGLVLWMGLSGQLIEASTIAWRHPRLALYLVLVGLGLGTAVLAYTRLIQASGSVVAVAVATTRKIATMLLSYIVWPKPLLTIHVISALMALGGILLNSFAKHFKKA